MIKVHCLFYTMEKLHCYLLLNKKRRHSDLFRLSKSLVLFTLIKSLRFFPFIEWLYPIFYEIDNLSVSEEIFFPIQNKNPFFYVGIACSCPRLIEYRASCLQKSFFFLCFYRQDRQWCAFFSQTSTIVCILALQYQINSASMLPVADIEDPSKEVLFYTCFYQTNSGRMQP